jgi:signal transduction histidine kinase
VTCCSSASLSCTRIGGSGAVGEIALTVVDDGRGFDTTRVQRTGGGLGLLSIEERARLLHGSVRIDTGAGRGTTVRVANPAAAASG